MIEYKKTAADDVREKSDLERSPIMRFLKHQDYYKFNVGDILVKQTRSNYLRDDWVTEKNVVGSPRKYVYVFENELGIGYIKQLKVDGTGFTTNLICTANFDPHFTRFMLDPDFVDHLLTGGGDDFQYNKEYIEKRTFRQEAIEKNTQILVNTRSAKKRYAWFHSLKVGDVFWFGDTFDILVESKFEVSSIEDSPKENCPRHVLERLDSLDLKYFDRYRTIVAANLRGAGSMSLTADYFTWTRVTMQEPFPLKDVLCGQPK